MRLFLDMFVSFVNYIDCISRLTAISRGNMRDGKQELNENILERKYVERKHTF